MVPGEAILTSLCSEVLLGFVKFGYSTSQLDRGAVLQD